MNGKSKTQNAESSNLVKDSMSVRKLNQHCGYELYVHSPPSFADCSFPQKRRKLISRVGTLLKKAEYLAEDGLKWVLVSVEEQSAEESRFALSARLPKAEKEIVEVRKVLEVGSGLLCAGVVLCLSLLADYPSTPSPFGAESSSVPVRLSLS